MTKLTLSMDKHIVKKAKLIAARHGLSVSRMFSDYVTRMTDSYADSGLTGDKALSKIAGAIHKKTTAKKDMQDYRKYLESKYGVYK